MASKEDSSERRLVPRWRYARRIVHTAEHSGDPRARPTFVSRLAIPQDVIENWRRCQSITTAADLVANAVAFLIEADCASGSVVTLNGEKNRV